MRQIWTTRVGGPEVLEIREAQDPVPAAGQVRVRVGGLLLRDGAMLLAAHRGLLPQNTPFWSPPGGGWQFGESIRAALVREFQEETGLSVRVGRFLHLHEFSQGNLQALELFFEVLANDAAQPQDRKSVV